MFSCCLLPLSTGRRIPVTHGINVFSRRDQPPPTPTTSTKRKKKQAEKKKKTDHVVSHLKILISMLFFSSLFELAQFLFVKWNRCRPSRAPFLNGRHKRICCTSSLKEKKKDERNTIEFQCVQDPSFQFPTSTTQKKNLGNRQTRTTICTSKTCIPSERDRMGVYMPRKRFLKTYE